MHFDFERLNVYHLMLGITRWAGDVRIPTARRHLRDQLLRAADSVVLNIAEGSAHPRGDARRNHYRIALGSAAEVAAVLDIVRPADGDARREELRRVGAMLAKMIQR